LTPTTKLIAIAGFLVLAAGIGLYSLRQSPPHQSPGNDLKETAAALHSVRSWHEDYEGPVGPKGDWMRSSRDMVCPTGMHVIVDEPDADSIPIHREYFYTAKHIYYRSPGGWTGLGGTPINQCLPPLHLDGVGIDLPLEDILSGARVFPRGTRMIGSASCRDYLVKSPWRDFIICVNQQDHLPREVVSSLFKDEQGEFVRPERATYSRWNSVSEFDLPDGLPSD
jgi:hypothetical protein